MYPTNVQSLPRLPSGLYAGSDAGSCCWLAKAAEFHVVRPPGAAAVTLKILIPDYALATGRTQRITARIDNGPEQVACCLGRGFHEVVFSMPLSTEPTADLVLEMAQTFVPARVGFGADKRSLSVLLRAVDFPAKAPTRRQGALLIVIFITIIATTYWRPIAGVLAIVVTDPFAFQFTAGSITLTLAQVVLIATIAGQLLYTRMRPPRPDKVASHLIIAQVALLFVAIISTLHSEFRGAAIIELWKDLQYLITFLAVYTAFRLNPNERVVRVAVATITIAVCALAVFQSLSGITGSAEIVGSHTLVRPSGPLEGPNQLGAFLAITIPVLGSFALGKKRPYLDVIAALTGTATLLLTFSRGSILSLVVSGVIVFALQNRSRWNGAVVLALAGTFVVLFVLSTIVFLGSSSHTVLNAAFGEPSSGFNGGLGTRTQLWHDARMLWKQSPLFGIGPGNFELQIAKVDPSGIITHANNAYFQALVETGIAGFLCFAVITALTIRCLTRPTGDVLTLGALAAATGLAFHQIFDYLTFYPKVGIIYWTILGVSFAIANSVRESETRRNA